MTTYPDQKAIRELAYAIWEERGRPYGTAQRDWEEAERRLASVDESGRETFPASDPPSTHMPDVPPANAEAKWQNAGGVRKP